MAIWDHDYEPTWPTTQTRELRTDDAADGFRVGVIAVGVTAGGLALLIVLVHWAAQWP